MEIHAIGIDLGKTLFHLVGVDLCGAVLVRKKCSRSQLLGICCKWQTAGTGRRFVGDQSCSDAVNLVDEPSSRG